MASRCVNLADEDEELEFEASPDPEVWKIAAPLARKCSICSVTQKTKTVKLEVTSKRR